MHERHVTDGDVVAKHAIGIGVDVQHRIVLDISASADFDAVGICAQHTAIKHRSLRTNFYIADQGGIRGDESRFVHARSFAIKRKDQSHATMLMR